MNPENFRKFIEPAICILITLFTALLILKFSLPFVMVLVVGGFVFAFSVIKIDIPVYISIILLIIMEEELAPAGSIFQYVSYVNFSGIPSLLETGIIILIFSFTTRFLLKWEKIWISPINLYLLVFFVLLIISFMVGLQNNYDKIILKEDFKKFFLPILYFFCCVNVLSSWKLKKIRFLIMFAFILILIKSCIGIINYLNGLGFIYEVTKRVVFLDTSDHLLFVTVIVVVVSLILNNRIRGRKLYLLLFSCIPILFSLIFSYRRTAWMGLLFSLVILFFLISTNRKVKMVAIGILVIPIVFTIISITTLIGISTPSEKFLTHRFVSVFDKTESSNVFHLVEWQTAIEDTKKQPILGLGLGSTHRFLSTYGEDIPNDIVHNAFLMLWMKMGLLAVILFLCCLFRYFNFGIRVIKQQNVIYIKSLMAGFFASCGFWIVALNVGPSWFYYRETCLMAFIASLVLSLSESEKKRA